MFKKVEVGAVDAKAVVFEELVVDVVQVGVAKVVCVVVGEDINLTGPLSLGIFSRPGRSQGLLYKHLCHLITN